MEDYRNQLQQQLDASDSFDSHQEDNMNLKMSGLPDSNSVYFGNPASGADHHPQHLDSDNDDSRDMYSRLQAQQQVEECGEEGELMSELTNSDLLGLQGCTESSASQAADADSYQKQANQGIVGCADHQRLLSQLHRGGGSQINYANTQPQQQDQFQQNCCNQPEIMNSQLLYGETHQLNAGISSHSGSGSQQKRRSTADELPEGELDMELEDQENQKNELEIAQYNQIKDLQPQQYSMKNTHQNHSNNEIAQQMEQDSDQEEVDMLTSDASEAEDSEQQSEQENFNQQNQHAYAKHQYTNLERLPLSNSESAGQQHHQLTQPNGQQQVQTNKQSLKGGINEDSDSDGGEIGAMRAKFNQILSNFEAETHSQAGTAYFNSQIEGGRIDEGMYAKSSMQQQEGVQKFDQFPNLPATAESQLHQYDERENTGGALNIQIGRQMFSSKPPLNPNTNHNQNTHSGENSASDEEGTPDRGQANSRKFYGSAGATAMSQGALNINKNATVPKNFTDKQRQAALARQLALEYGNLQRQRLQQQSRPKSSQNNQTNQVGVFRQASAVVLPSSGQRNCSGSNEPNRKQLDTPIQKPQANIQRQVVRSSSSQRQLLSTLASKRPQTAKASNKPIDFRNTKSSQKETGDKVNSKKYQRNDENFGGLTNAVAVQPQTARNGNTQAISRPQTAVQHGVNNPLSTVVSGASPLATQKAKIKPLKKVAPKKADPVARHANMQTQWKKSTFLQAPSGRKLELDRFNKWRQLADTVNEKNSVKKGQVHKVLAQNARSQAAQAPVVHQSNREEMRYQLRSKIANKDYCDRSLTKFHYNNTLSKIQSQQNLSKEEMIRQQQNKVLQEQEQKIRQLESDLI